MTPALPPGDKLDQLIRLARHCTINNDTVPAVIEEMRGRFRSLADTDDGLLFLAAHAALLADKWLLEGLL